MTKTIDLPQTLNIESLNDFCSKLDNTLDAEERIGINFTPLDYIYPTAMLVVGSKIRDWVNYRKTKELRSFRKEDRPHKSVNSYLGHLGFFKFIRLDEGNEVGQARGSSNYVPITPIYRPEFDPVDDSIQDWYQSIQFESRRLAEVLANGDDQASDIYTYSIREIIRNVFEHTRASECYVCGQRWQNGKVEISIIDEGEGIASTLAESFEIKSDDQALEMAITPGISRTTNKPEGHNFYGNSGFGLYVLNEIGSKYGWFTLGSGKYRLQKSEDTTLMQQLNFNGTFIGLQINKPETGFENVISQIIEKGESESEKKGIKRKASGASKSLNL